MQFVIKYTWHIWIPTCFGTDVPSSKIYYVKCVKVNLPGFAPLLANLPGLCTFFVIIPWRWHLVAETCSSLSMWCILRHEFHLLDTIPILIQGVGLRPLACCDREFEFHPGHGCLAVVSLVCCQVEVSAMDWSFVQRSPTDCGASLCVIK